MLQVRAAYGKVYRTTEEIKKAWADNKDFKIVNGPYINRADWVKYNKGLDSIVFATAAGPIHLEVGILA